MKTLFPFLAAALMLSCSPSTSSTPEDQLRKNIETELFKVLNDPSSYEYVSMTTKRELTLKERCKTVNKKELQNYIEKGFNDASINQIQKELAYYNTISDSAEIVLRYVTVTCRATNKFGAKILGDFSATVLANNEVVRIKQMD